VQPDGYPLEQHFATTEDGYVLGLYRIPHGRPGSPGAAAAAAPSPAAPRPPVLLMHGLLCSAAEFLLQGRQVRSWLDRPESGPGAPRFTPPPAAPGQGPTHARPWRPIYAAAAALACAQSLAQMLADAGFDVWLGNARGNTFSRAHTHLTPSSAAYWAFSWDDTADKDLPAMGNYILGASGAAGLAYVAHSQGTTVGLAALAGGRGFAEQVQVRGPGGARGGPAAAPAPPASRRRRPAAWTGGKGTGDAAAGTRCAPLAPDHSFAGRCAVQVAVLMAPVAFAHHISSPALLALASFSSDQLFELLGMHEFLPSIEVGSSPPACLASTSLPLQPLGAHHACTHRPQPRR
jgi:hypothetical protein